MPFCVPFKCYSATWAKPLSLWNNRKLKTLGMKPANLASIIVTTYHLPFIFSSTIAPSFITVLSSNIHLW